MDDKKLTDKENYTKDLFEDLKYSLNQFDTQSLALSGGALGFSLTFLKEIVPYEKAVYPIFFYIALILFVYTITVGFVGHYLSTKQILNSIDCVSRNEFSRIKADKIIPRLNLSIVWSLPLGILSLVIFCIINIETNKIMSKKKEIKANQIQIDKTTENGSRFRVEGEINNFYYTDTAKSIITNKNK